MQKIDEKSKIRNRKWNEWNNGWANGESWK